MDTYDILWRIHAGLMTAGFAAMGTGIYINMFLKQKKWRIQAHKRLEAVGVITALSAFIIAFIMVRITYSGYHFSTLHAVTGLITVILILTNPIVGYRMMTKGVKNRTTLRIVHTWLGRTVFILMASVIFLGLSLMGII